MNPLLRILPASGRVQLHGSHCSHYEEECTLSFVAGRGDMEVLQCWCYCFESRRNFNASVCLAWVHEGCAIVSWGFASMFCPGVSTVLRQVSPYQRKMLLFAHTCVSA